MPNSWYVNPNTNIKILTGIPLDNTYEHTIYFNNRQTQANYFAARTLYDLTAQSYQRIQRGKMRVKVNAENLYNANYLMFQNAAFGNKWFYAFIVAVEYINDAVSEISFEIDVMQTWLEGVGLDYLLGECFVEREHTQTDVLFENLVEENLDIGSEYLINHEDSYDMSAMRVLIMVNRDTEASGQMPGQTINGIYSPVYIIDGLNPSSPSLIDSAISNYLEDEIICVYQYPAFIDSNNGQDVKAIAKNTGSLDGYTPRNKKLFNYPYNFLLVSNNSGQTANYRWEDFDSPAANFTIKGVKISTPSVLCYPRYYRGLNEGFDDGITYANFPECAWSGDTFKAWWAQNKASFVTSGLITAVNDLVGKESAGSFSNDMPGLGLTTYEMILSKVAQIQDIKAMPNQTHGKTQTDSLNPAMGRVKFSFYNMTIKSAYARIIDDYFDRFGYACRKNKIPNTHVRPHWTFTKTLGCCIRGSIPADDMRKICSIYDNGITFWLNGSEIGDYSLDNRV